MALSSEVYSVKDKPQIKENNIADSCHALTRYLTFHNNRRRSQTPRGISSPKQSLTLDNERQVILTGVATIVSMVGSSEIEENSTDSQAPNRSTA
ncbi:unnamed protein product [Schistosoma mattheei]|uniref:Uncharacterized protein n=1 Tax=Schistosoma mattheei TaxID=31246 RepID=A0A183NJS9_9TREM|nr:unnamed protein product [Schistosoma mattheei]